MDVFPSAAASPAVARVRRPRRASRGPGPTLWAVASGKGGVGKSVVSSSLAIALASTGPRAIAVDLDFGGANLHTLFGCAHTRHGLGDVLRGGVPIEQALVDTTVPGVRLLSGARAGLDAANPHHAKKGALLRALRRLDAGHVVIDLGAGSHFNTLDFFVAADRRVLVTTPENTAIENAYHFLKAAFFRSLREVARDPDVREVLEGVLEAARRDGASPRELVEAAGRVDPKVGDRLRARANAFEVDLLLNRAELAGSRETGLEMAAATRAHLGANLRLAGALHTDASVTAAIARGVPVLQLFAGCAFSRDLRGAVERMVADEPIPMPHAAETAARGPASKEAVASPRPPMPRFDGIDPGPHLRACRELLGMTLHELHERTRIRHHHLERIEAEQFAALPPDFYLREYVRQIAEVLGLPDGPRLARRFVERARERRPGPGKEPAPAPSVAAAPRRASAAPPVPRTEELIAILDFEPELEGFARSFGRGSARPVAVSSPLPVAEAAGAESAGADASPPGAGGAAAAEAAPREPGPGRRLRRPGRRRDG